MKEDTKLRVKCIAIPLAVGIVSGLLSREGMMSFEELPQPPLSPPSWLFPVAWTILYILMGIASYLVLRTDSEINKKALFFYALQLVFNFFWSLIFFNMRAFLFALIWLIILWVLILITTVLFGKVNKKAAYLMVPYLLWVSFAIYLNAGVYVLNR